MRWILAVGFVALAGFASAQDYSKKDACMRELSKAISTADAFSNQREVRSFQFETVPDFGTENVEQIIDGFETIQNAWRSIADELFELCGKYPSM